MQNTTTANFSDYLIFADESGDERLNFIDKNYPIFLLAFVIIHKDEYINNLLPKIQKLKLDFFGHENINLHENEIRREKNYFAILRTNKNLRENFYQQLNNIIKNTDFKIVSYIIDKHKFNAAKYIYNPYALAIYFCLSKILNYLLIQQQNAKSIYVNFESRDDEQNKSLELGFKSFMINKTYLEYENLEHNFSLLDFKYQWVEKKCNLIGLQLADLVARPIGLNFLNPTQNNRAYEIIKNKIWDCKCFP